MHVKHFLRGPSFEPGDERPLANDAVLRGIERRTLDSAFFDRTPGLRKYIEADDDYVEGI
jgi:hypothetical protein